MDGQTTTRADYKWPYPKPINFRPSSPPLFTKPTGFYMRRPTTGYCHCDTHQYDGEMNQYKALAHKETILKAELQELDEKMLKLSNGILDHPCDDDDTKLETVYQTDYKKRGIPLITYPKLIAAVESKVADPVVKNKIGISEGYRDPCSFRYTAIIRPIIDPPNDAFFKTTPQTIKDWLCPITGQTEYQDTISKTGVAILRHRQQYREPLPSSRRRFGDPCL